MADVINRWTLTDQVKEKFVPIVQAFIDNEDLETDEIDLSDTELKPCTLAKILESMGYKHVDSGQNGWEIDFWLVYSKPGMDKLIIDSCGQTFELRLRKDD